MFEKVLIANRGEIGLRVARCCRDLGMRVVAVYSTEDRDSALVRMADETVHIGPAPARHSYLNIPALIEAALRTGARALHPGYGFASENPDLAEVCEDHGITFVGPSATVIDRLGDKVSARALMAEAGLPLLPGGVEPAAGLEEARALAAETGYPLIIKPVAGGGGRGMQVVRGPGELAAKYRQARGKAQALFGDNRVYLERYLASARHVEIQVLGDRLGNVVHLGERDCSVQRRNQKIIEESPAHGLPADVVRRMGEAALLGAKAAEYTGAGTFEFLVDDTGDFYFMEVNCRIQVEHPVTEMVTGVDLVREQFRVAAGLPLELCQSGVAPRGAAIECRVNAEDPARDFLPAPGPIEEFTAPAGPFVRVDTDCFPGHRISAAYDPLLAKVITWAPDRAQARERMRRALDEFHVSGPGVRTNIPFLRRVLDDPRFADGTHTTSLVADLTSQETLG
ncbi:acetyl/propionyl/methylcrotonyl-CoA carboxylase subunit alpha [Streptomyces sp. NPDC055962]|uniref:acetyl-CoA carboxylase biotin carboxylase subunit n=1 Tax=unclassified Streptomyces TaxID=2593676 RepID=UPI0035DACACA